MKEYHINIKNIISLVLKKGFYKKDILIKIPKLKKEMYVDTNFSVLKNHKNEIVGIICFTRDVTQKKIAENKIKEQSKLLSYQSTHDPLTGLFNRRFFEVKLQEVLEDIKNKNTTCALLFIDLDNFKEINDTLGHNIGDEVLKEVAKRLSSFIRSEDVLSRIGGDEFTIILKNIKNPENVKVVVKKIFNAINKEIKIGNNEIFLSASIGITLCPRDSVDKNEAIKFADAAMYKAKESGKNRYEFYSPNITKEALERVSIQYLIRKALENDEFVVYYQPQVDGKSNKIVGMEALVRWINPEEGIIPPGKFIPIAEKSDLIVKIDNCVMKKAMNDFSNWYKKGLNPGTLSLNLSIKQMDFDNLIDTILKTAKKTDFNLEWLELEVTESLMMRNIENVIKKLNIIHDLGIKIAIDDFGTGYSSLSYLKRLPVDKLKIDKSFVDNLPEDEEDIAISKAIIALSNSLNLKTIAEGVETKAQLDFLVENGCDYIQGYYYSPPVPKEEIEKFLIKKSF
jgi:diguanylate cyclase (GGDEF)-like protein